jgi:hypothetical protein
VRRLFKAEASGKITFGRIVVVDRDPSCAVAGLVSERVRLEVATWEEWLGEHLSRASMGDQLVPYHWAPHVLLDWLSKDLARHGVILERTGERVDPPARPRVLRETQAGDLALSYADWLCPPACIEPALCPHTRGPRSWSLAGELAVAPHSFVFPCLHLVYGVGTIPLSAIFGVRDRLLGALRRRELHPREPVWIGSASHCHGLAARVTLQMRVA